MTEIKKLFICNSNMFIPMVLSEILQHVQHQYIVMSDIKNIHRFFEYISVSNVIFIPYGVNFVHDGKLSFIKKKKETMTALKPYHIEELVFFHAEFGDMGNWLIYRLSKQIPVKYCKQYNKIPSQKAKLSWRSIMMKIKLYVLWGQIMEIRDAGHLFPSLPDSFFRKVNAGTVHIDVNLEVINSYLSDKFKNYNLSSKYVLLTGTAVQNSWYDEKEYTDFIDKLITTIGKENVVSKCHPRYDGLYGLEKELRQIPSFIPGNLLLNHYEIFIGIESTLLVEAAQAGKKAVSIIDWLESDKERIKGQHDFFDSRLDGKGMIFCPKNMAEFIAIVK